MAHKELDDYIEKAKNKNLSDDKIRSNLLKSGWNESDVNEALKPASSDDLDLPPPPAPRFGMWVSFQYIILFITLYVSATSLGGILHEAIKDLIPDKLDSLQYYSYSRDNDFLIKCYIASLIVAFPIFAGLFMILKRQALKRPIVKSIRSRKLLIYITLIGTFIIMIGHLIKIIFDFLNGSVTMRSLGHLGVTFLVAGSIFGYLLYEVREDRKANV